MLNSVMGSMELCFLYLVLVAVLFAKYRGKHAMVHTAAAKSTFVGFGILVVSVVIGLFEFEATTSMKIAILGNTVSLWVYMLKHVYFAYKCSMPSRPVAKVTEEEIMLTEEELDELGVSPELKSKLLGSFNKSPYKTLDLGTVKVPEDVKQRVKKQLITKLEEEDFETVDLGLTK